MKREEYLKYSKDYFHGDLSFFELTEKLNKKLYLNVERIPLPVNERIMLIANHPDADQDLYIPSEDIAGCKGGNKYNFSSFWFPAIRQIMLYKAMQRRFFTIAHDIGWKDSMQEMRHLLINSKEGGRTQEIISCMKKDQSSLVIFPEGGVRNLDIFRTGFFYIACELKIRYLVVGIFSPITLSLRGKNVFQVISIEDMSVLINSVVSFVDKQREKIKKALACNV